VKTGLQRVQHVFVHGNARRLLYVRLAGQAGDGLLQTALATFVLFSPQREANPSRIAFSFALLLIPYSVVGPFVGVFIDRWPRRHILIAANTLRVLTMFAISIIITQHSANALLAGFVLVSLGINRFVQAALAASLPHVIGDDELLTANSLFPTLGTMAASAAAAIGLTVQHFAGNTDTVNALLVLFGATSAMAAAVIAWAIRAKYALGPTHELSAEHIRNVAYGLIQGWRKLRAERAVQLSMFSVVLQRFVFGAITVNALIFSRTLWQSPTQTNAAIADFGLCAGAAALGALFAATISAFLLSASQDHQVKTAHTSIALNRVIVGGACGATTVVLAAALSRSLVWTVAAAAALGFIGQLLKIHADTTIQQSIDDEHRGRVFSIFDMAINVAVVAGISAFALTGDLRTNVWLDVLILLVPLSGVITIAVLRMKEAND